MSWATLLQEWMTYLVVCPLQLRRAPNHVLLVLLSLDQRMLELIDQYPDVSGPILQITEANFGPFVDAGTGRREGSSLRRHCR